MKKISIIVPVYNIATLLPRCLRSILEQDYADFEVWCINDGSTDSSLSILEDFASSDTRIKVLSQPNGGVSNARNTGISQANGEYLIFVDPDDVLPLGALQASLNSIDGSTNDYVIFKVFNPARSKTKVYPKTVWGKIWKQSFLISHKLKFDESLAFGEDYLFVKQAEYLSENYAFSDHVTYHYYSNDGSLSTRRDKRRFTAEAVVVNLKSFLDERGLFDTHKDDFLAVKASCYWNLFVEVLPSFKLAALKVIQSGLKESEVAYISRKRLHKKAHKLELIVQANGKLSAKLFLLLAKQCLRSFFRYKRW